MTAMTTTTETTDRTGPAAEAAPPDTAGAVPDTLPGATAGRQIGAAGAGGRRGRRLSPLALATAGAVAALTAVLGYLWAYLFEAPVIGTLVGTMFALGALSLLAILAGWRWAPALGVLLTALVGGLLVGANWEEYVRSVSNPRDPLYLPLVLLVPPMVLATGLGIAATVQNYRLAAPRRRAPRWLVPALAVVGGATAGYLLLGLLPRPLAALTVSPQTYSTLPGVETREFQFQPGELRVRAGQPVALRLMNHDRAPHSFDVDELDVHAPMTSGEPGLVVFTAARPGSYLFYCAVPGHADKASEAGMVGRLVVTP
jgi:uncharacterized cupredoxin-like copper-binding protein